MALGNFFNEGVAVKRREGLEDGSRVPSEDGACEEDCGVDDRGANDGVKEAGSEGGRDGGGNGGGDVERGRRAAAG